MAVIQEIKVPLLAVNDTSLTVVEMNFINGQKVKPGDNLLVFETSKTTYDLEATVEGFVEFLCDLGSDYEVNDIIVRIHDSPDEITATPIPSQKQHGQVQAGNGIEPTEMKAWEGETIFSAEAMRLMQSHGLAPTAFGGKDFVSKTDVEDLLGIGSKRKAKGSVGKETRGSKRMEVTVDATRVIVEKLSSNKRREIEYLSEVQSTGLTSTINTTVETAGIFTFINPSLQYLKNSLLPVIIYEASRLLEKYPLLNAYATEDGIAIYKDVQVGFAVDMEKGLKVLKVPNSTQLSITEVEQSIMNVSNRYLDETLSLEDLTDISFTITDLSAEGVSFFRPLVNMMNSAILGISAIDERFNRCTLSVTFDHRVTEGKLAAQFLRELKQRIESYQARNYPTLMQDISCSKCGNALKEDLGNIGFVKCITPQGTEGYLCQSCLKGF